jgi:hypothetical protein
MVFEVLRIQGFARCTFHQVISGQQAAFAPNV